MMRRGSAAREIDKGFLQNDLLLSRNCGGERGPMIMAKRTIALIFAACMVVFKGTVAGVSGTLRTPPRRHAPSRCFFHWNRAMLAGDE